MSYFRILIISSLALLLKTSIEAEFLVIGKTVSIFRSPEAEGLKLFSELCLWIYIG